MPDIPTTYDPSPFSESPDVMSFSKLVFEKDFLVRLYNTAYEAGHHDTVEGTYNHILEPDIYTFHKEEVERLAKELSKDTPNGNQTH